MNKENSKDKLTKDDLKDKIMRRSLFYAICIFALFQFMLVPLQRQSYMIFWTLGVGGFMVVLMELFYSRVSDRPLGIRLKLVKRKVWRKHFLQHLILPSMLYFSGITFLFFNRIKILDQFSVLIISMAFWVLLLNISMNYLKLYRTSKRTRYIFDFVRIIIFYFVTDVLINLVNYYGVSRMFVYVGVGLTVFVLILMMMIVFDQKQLKLFMYNFISSLLIACLTWVIINYVILNIAIIALVVTVGFYLIVVFWHHQLEGTFNWDIMIQYLLFAIMATILLLYL